MKEFREDVNFIIINEPVFVPGKGKGPFTKPFKASGSQIRLFRRLNIQVTIVDEDYEVSQNDQTEVVRNETPKVEENKETENNVSEDSPEEEETTEDEDVKEENSVETEVEEDHSEETEENTEEAEETLTKSELEQFTVSELKKELDNRGIEYARNARKNDLIELLINNA